MASLAISSPAAGKQDERERRVVLADLPEEVEPVAAGHLVVAHDAVDVVVERIERVRDAMDDLGFEAVVLPFEMQARDGHEVGVVVDEEHRYRLPDSSHTTVYSPLPVSVCG